jgi:hypothetical protein
VDQGKNKLGNKKTCYKPKSGIKTANEFPPREKVKRKAAGYFIGVEASVAQVKLDCNDDYEKR